MLHALFYLNPGDLPEKQLEKIVELSGILETPIGYRAYESQLANQGGEEYYTRIVWPFEQAMIHIGAKKFGLNRVAKVSSRVMQHLDTAPECFVLEDKEIRKDGCDPQLWTIATKKYFERNP